MPKPSGYVETTDTDGRTVTLETHSCAHCGMHWVPVPGSRRARGFCTKCMSPVCGKPACVARCDPWEKKLDRLERTGKW